MTANGSFLGDESNSHSRIFNYMTKRQQGASNMSSCYLLIVLDCVWKIAEANDGFCLEVLDLLKRILHLDR